MQNFILHQIYAGYEKKVWKQNCSFQKYIQIFYIDYFSIRVVFFILLRKNIIIKSKIQFSRQNIQDTEKMLRNNIIYLENIYNFGVDHFSIRVISFVY